MPEITIDVEVWCATCGAGLCRQATDNSKPGRPGIAVEVCEHCADTARQEGYAEGCQASEEEEE